MNYLPKLLFFFLCPLILSAQLTDDFSDGDFDNNPTWTGDVGSFIVNGQNELQLQAAAAGTSILYTPVEYPDSLEWTFYFRLDFAPSSSNLTRIYLQANDSDLINADGYYLQLGQTGSADALMLYRQDGGSSELLASGSPVLGSEPALARINIRRSAIGEWTVLADYAGGSNYQTEFSIVDATYGKGAGFFGFYAKYTSSRVEQFFYDDVNITELLPDITPPSLVEVQVIDDKQLQLTFNEILTSASASNTANYQINNSIGQPASAILDPSNPTLVLLTLVTSLQSPQNYTLEVENLSDAAGNLSPQEQATFSYIQFEIAAPYDILINEIMADPTIDGGGTIGLPAIEYIELYNRSNKIIDLKDFILADRAQEILLPSFALFPDSYVIMHARGETGLGVFGDTLAVSNFPGLGNNDDDLELMNAEGDLISAVYYDITWYRDSRKADGGWSLELIRPNSPCEEQSNWIASSSPLGGSPGQINAVFDAQADEDGPDLTRAFPLDKTKVRLYFNESVAESPAGDKDNYQIDGLTVIDALPEAPLFNTLILEVQEEFVENTIYEVTLRNAITDCVGNVVGTNSSARFGIPEELEARDVVINELLYQAEVGGSRFLELYNRSSKIANIGEMLLATRDALGEVDNVRPIEIDYLLFPGDYVVLSPDPEDVQRRYFSENPLAYVQNSLPSYNSKEDTVVVYTAGPPGAVIIDELAYTADFHHALLDVTRGVSLERIDPSAATQSPANWHSAAEQVGFATPTYLNSQFMAGEGVGDQIIAIPNARLSPDGDGFEDFLLINYQTDQVGYTANIKIYDAGGREIRTLISNELLAAEGSIKWDGDTDQDSRARLGIYIVWIELFTPQGDVRYFKEPCVLAGKLD